MVFRFKLPKIELSPLKQVIFVLREVARLMWRADRKFFLIMISGSFLVGLSNFPTLLLEKLFLDTLTTGLNNQLFLVSFRLLVIIVVTRFVLLLLKEIISRVSNRSEHLLELKFYNLINLLTAQKYSSLDVPMIENAEFKDRYTKIIRTTGNRAFRIATLFGELPGFVSGMVASLGIFIFIQPWVLPLVTLFAIPAFVANSKISKKRYEMETVLSPIFRLRGRIEYFLTQSSRYLELRLLQISEYLSHKYAGYQEQVYDKRQRLDKEIRVTNFLVSLPRMIFSNCLDLYAGFLALTQKITIGSAFAFVRAVNNFDTNFQGLARNIAELYENYLYIADLIWLLNLPAHNPKTGQPFPRQIRSGIKFDHVWFKYPESENWIIKDLSLEIFPKENFAIVGENGVGKSTLVKLLCGFYVPDKGQITINGQSVFDFSREQYWQNIGVMFQDFENYSFTARENIGYGHISRVDDLNLIRKYAKLADADEWIMSLPLQYENPLSRDFEKGVNPSGGQMQKIVIARTLIRESQIVVLDEPTSNVDPKAEEEIFSHVLKLGKDKILIFISHRFSTVRRANKIAVIDDGQVIETGTHEQLMKAKGTYARLFTLQAKSYQ